jgi:hypothetical protein
MFHATSTRPRACKLKLDMGIEEIRSMTLRYSHFSQSRTMSSQGCTDVLYDNDLISQNVRKNIYEKTRQGKEDRPGHSDLYTFLPTLHRHPRQTRHCASDHRPHPKTKTHDCCDKEINPWTWCVLNLFLPPPLNSNHQSHRTHRNLQTP